MSVILCEDPFICYVDDFIEHDLCDEIIRLAKPNLKRAGVSVMESNNISTGRTNFSHWIKKHMNEKLQNLAEECACLVDCEDCNCFEDFQTIYYDVGQEYKYHYDAYDKNEPEKYKKFCKYGNRLVTVLGYLNDVEEGGETRFDKLDLSVQPKKGRIIIFENLKPDGSVHELSRHAGLPVKKGEKWAFNLWLRERPTNVDC